MTPKIRKFYLFLVILNLISVSASLEEEGGTTEGTTDDTNAVITGPISDKFRDSVGEPLSSGGGAVDEEELFERLPEDASSSVVESAVSLSSSGGSSSNTPSRFQPLIIKSNPIISSLPTQIHQGSSPVVLVERPLKATSSSGGSGGGGENKSKSPGTLNAGYNFQYGDFTPGASASNNVKTQLDHLFSKVHSFPQLALVASPLHNNDAFIQGVQYIKDAYFEVLENLREFRQNVAKRMEAVEAQIQDLATRINETTLSLPVTLPESLATQLDNMITQSWFLRMRELERVFNMSRMVDHCAHYIVGNQVEEALGIWLSLEDATNRNPDQTGKNLMDIVKLAYARNASNSSPVFRFLRKLGPGGGGGGVDKIPVYDFLVSGMKRKENFEGSEIFYIAQYLKERNAVRSSVYSKIPRAVQYAVSGRNVNIVFVGREHGRNYVHVRDDYVQGQSSGNSRERSNFYVQASQSYTDTRSAVWNFIFQPSTDTFHIRNSLFGDFMFVNGEGFLETLPPNAALTSGAEFTFVLRNNSVVINSAVGSSSSSGGVIREEERRQQPLVVVRGGGKFPYYFSLQSENPHAPPAQFLVEPDTLL